MIIKKHVGFALVLITGLASTATAQSSFQVLGDLNAAQTRFSSLENSASFGGDRPLNFNISHPRLGSLAVSFSEQPTQNRGAYFRSGNQDVRDSSAVLLLQGTGNLNGVSIPVAGSVYRENGTAALHVNFVAPASSFNSYTTPVEVTQKLDASGPSVEIPRADILDGKKCGAELLPATTAPVTSGRYTTRAAGSTGGVTASAIRVIDIATEADFQYYSRYGAATNAHIASIINAAQVIYERDLGLRFNIIRQRVRTSSTQPYTSSVSDTLLDQLGSEVASSGGLQGADVVHLFTGKDLVDNIVGLAWLGVLCTTPSLSTGLTQAISSSVDPVIFAHETGHNLGADHDSSLPRSLMYPMAGSDQTFVSLASRNEVAQYFAVGGDDCFAADVGGTPTPAPTATPVPTATPGGDLTGGSGGGGTTAPAIGFSVTFNKLRGILTINMSKKNVTPGTCTALVRIGGRPVLTNAGGVEFDSQANRLVFTTRTPKRLSSSRGRIFLEGEYVDCPNGENLKSQPVDISPIYARTTRRSDKVTSRAWINYAIQKMSVSER